MKINVCGRESQVERSKYKGLEVGACQAGCWGQVKKGKSHGEEIRFQGAELVGSCRSS